MPTALRRRFLPSVHGPPGWLADLIAVVAATVTISEALGTVHLFRPGVLTAVLVASGGAAWYVGRHGAGAGLADAAHGHAQVLALDDDDDTSGAGDLGHRVGDLGGQPLLDLWTLGEAVDQTGDLREPRRSPARAARRR